MILLYVYNKWWRRHGGAVKKGDYFTVKEGSERIRRGSDDANVIYKSDRS